MWQALKHRSFARLFCATLVSESGTQIHRVALLVLVYTMTQDALWVSLVLATQLLATVGVGPALSAWSETQDRRRLLVASDLARAVLVPLIPLIGIHSWGILLLLVFVIDILRNLHDPIANAVIPDLVPGKRSRFCQRLDALHSALYRDRRRWFGRTARRTHRSGAGSLVRCLDLFALRADPFRIAALGTRANQRARLLDTGARGYPILGQDTDHP